MSAFNRIANIFLDEKSVVRRSPRVEHERKVAIYDLLVENEFILLEGALGPYNLHLAFEDDRLAFDICDEDDDDCLNNMPTGDHYELIDPFPVKVSVPGGVVTS